MYVNCKKYYPCFCFDSEMNFVTWILLDFGDATKKITSSVGDDDKVLFCEPKTRTTIVVC